MLVIFNIGINYVLTTSVHFISAKATLLRKLVDVHTVNLMKWLKEFCLNSS